jgi:sulfur-carrier protein adenylyltransferase/sulfurtransferase
MFSLQYEPLNHLDLERNLGNHQAGAWITFEGRVRNIHKKKEVLHLEYEAYEELAQKEAELIFNEAREKFQILEVKGWHRLGVLPVGELALWISIASAHRKEGFRAIEYIIDEIKARLPIWKKEFFVDGSSHWVDCRGCYHQTHSITKKEYYQRQISLPEVGSVGQARLKSSRVLVVGAGGLGCPALAYLAGAGVGRITVCDGDIVQLSNLHRQFLFSHLDVGKSKTEAACKFLKGLNPLIEIEAYPKFLDEANSDELVVGNHLVLDCMDNFEAKLLLHDACRRQKVPLIQASLYRFEGQLQVFRHKEEEACLRCLWPKIPQIADRCVEAGILGAVAGVFGSMQATLALSMLLSEEEAVNNEMLVMDVRTQEISKFQRKKNHNCPFCFPKEVKVEALSFEKWELEFSLDILENYELIDIRNSRERNLNNPWEAYLKHVKTCDLESQNLSDEKQYLLVCQRGIRSKSVVERLRRKGLKQFFSLKGGIASLEKGWDKLALSRE